MKKISRVSLTLLALLMVFSLTACNGVAPEELAGTWVLVGAESGGQHLTTEDLATQGADVAMSLEFKNDKKVLLTGFIDGASAAEAAKYTFENNVVTLTNTSPQTELRLEDGKLLLEQSGVTLIFERN